MATKWDLRHTLFRLLNSDAARKIDFVYDGVYFTGNYFSNVIAALILRWDGNHRGIDLLLLEDDPFAEAMYRSGHPRCIAVPSFEYATANPEQQETLVHECFHAWRDLAGPKSVATVTDEAMSYLVGALFTLRNTANGKPPAPTPSWAVRDPGVKDLAVEVFAEAYRIAESIWNTPRAVVSTTDVAALNHATDVAYAALARQTNTTWTPNAPLHPRGYQ